MVCVAISMSGEVTALLIDLPGRSLVGCRGVYAK